MKLIDEYYLLGYQLKIIMSVSERHPETEEKTVVPPEHNAKINQRKGHRSWVTRTMNETNDALIHFSEDRRADLAGWKVVLNDKLGVLEKYDAEIMGYLTDEDALEKEILAASKLRSDMQKMIVRIETKLEKTGSQPPDASEGSSSRINQQAKLPKLTIKSFGVI